MSRNFFASRTRPIETGLVGWGARTRTWEWRNQNPSGSHYLSTRVPKNRGNSTSIRSIGCRTFRNAGTHPRNLYDASPALRRQRSQVRILSGAPLRNRSVPDTWVTVYTGDMGNTFG